MRLGTACSFYTFTMCLPSIRIIRLKSLKISNPNIFVVVVVVVFKSLEYYEYLSKCD